MRLVAFGHVRRDGGVAVGGAAPQVRSHSFPAMENLHGDCGGAGLQGLPGELVGDAVIMTVHPDVVIDGGANRFPVGQHVALGGQRLQRGPIQAGKQAGTRAFAFSEGPLIEFFVNFRQG